MGPLREFCYHGEYVDRLMGVPKEFGGGKWGAETGAINSKLKVIGPVTGIPSRIIKSGKRNGRE